MTLVRNTFWLYLMYASNLILPLFVFPYWAKVLGLENFGLLVSTQSMAMFAVLIMDYGFNWSATQLLAKSDKSLITKSKIFWTVQAGKFILAVVGSILIFSIIYLNQQFKQDSSLYLISWSIIFGSLLSPLWFYQGLEKSAIPSIAWVISRLVIVIATIVMVNEEDDLYLAAAIYAWGPIFSGIIIVAYILINKDIVVCKIKKSEVYQVIHDSWGAFVGNLFTGGVGHLITVVLNMFAGPAYAGYFAAADRLRQMGVSLMVPLGQAAFVRLNTVSFSGVKLAWTLAVRYFIAQSMVGFLLAFLIFIFREDLIFLLYGSGFLLSSDVLGIMAIAFFFTAINHAFGFQGMLTFGLGSLFWKILLLGFVVNIIILVFFIKTPYMVQYELSGAIAMLISEFLICCIFLFVLIKHRLAFISNNKD